MAIEYTVGNLNRIVEEKGNTFIALRSMKWCAADVDKDFKIDIRKYYMSAEGETVSKGISFGTEEGPHELTRVLAEEGFGHTDEILEAIKDREDFMSSLSTVLNDEQLDTIGIDPKDYKSEDFYDPREKLLA